jgi:hypothetical protein
MFTAVWETFSGMQGPQFDVSDSDTVDIFENISDTALMQLIVNEKQKKKHMNTMTF